MKKRKGLELLLLIKTIQTDYICELLVFIELVMTRRLLSWSSFKLGRIARICDAVNVSAGSSSWKNCDRVMPKYSQIENKVSIVGTSLPEETLLI